MIELATAKLSIGSLLSTAGWSLLYYHKILDVFEWLLLYSIKIYIGITTSISWASSTCVLFTLLLHLVNGAQFLNFIFL